MQTDAGNTPLRAQVTQTQLMVRRVGIRGKLGLLNGALL
jgi:hypothetical protein